MILFGSYVSVLDFLTVLTGIIVVAVLYMSYEIYRLKYLEERLEKIEKKLEKEETEIEKRLVKKKK